jgi:hypothetical protein
MRDSAMISEGLDGSDPDALPAQCEFDPDGEPLPVTNERNRDSNIYGSLIKDQLRLYAPTPAKPLTGVVRAFVVALSNSDINPRTYEAIATLVRVKRRSGKTHQRHRTVRWTTLWSTARL